MQFEKTIHTFFLILRSSILKMNYLCNFRYLIYEIWPWISPLNLLSNAIGMTRFGFLKSNLCPISYDDLIMDWFSRANLYELKRVTVSSFGFEIDRQETTVCVLAVNFYSIPIRCSERELWRFSHDKLFEMKFKSLNKT